MIRQFITTYIDDQLAIRNATFAEVLDEARKYAHAVITVENASGVSPITYAQIKWFKGILLAKLAEDTGESIGYWEDLLKLNVMPDKFAWTSTKTPNGEFEHLPSITILNKSEMGEMIVGCVAHLRDETKYGTKFHWVTLPDPELRS